MFILKPLKGNRSVEIGPMVSLSAGRTPAEGCLETGEILGIRYLPPRGISPLKGLPGCGGVLIYSQSGGRH